VELRGRENEKGKGKGKEKDFSTGRGGGGGGGRLSMQNRLHNLQIRFLNPELGSGFRENKIVKKIKKFLDFFNFITLKRKNTANYYYFLL
jgi:hypothetical protein